MRLLSLTALSVLILSASAADWAQFQGAGAATETSPETGLLRQWPPNGPPVEWARAHRARLGRSVDRG